MEHPHMGLAASTVGSVTVLSVHGDVDLSSAPLLEEYAFRLLDDEPGSLVVDLTDVQFLASTGMALLVELSRRTAGRAGFAVVANGTATARPLELLGLCEMFTVRASLDEALTDLGGERARCRE